MCCDVFRFVLSAPLLFNNLFSIYQPDKGRYCSSEDSVRLKHVDSLLLILEIHAHNIGYIPDETIYTWIYG